ncbi:MAG: hypothetical protein HY699_04080 [Deltaproteobacteria bacterium]|nr:hypothetical protein [Deltaproteobacteria bacterium]
MSLGMPESDWKAFRELRQVAVALERFCERVINDIRSLSSSPSKTFHERYLEVYRLLDRRDHDRARAFDDPRRSQATTQLAEMCTQGLLEPEELARFSSELAIVLSLSPKS